jgi:hypothetical protein
MVFSDTTNKSGILQRIEMTLGLPDGAITGDTTQLAYFTTLVNETYYDIVMHILSAQDSWDFDDKNYTDYPIATTDMVADQRDYPFPSALKVMKIKRVDVTYNGVDYYKATPIDSSEFGDGLGNPETEDRNFSKTSPAYDMQANAVFVYPLPTTEDVTAGAKIRLEFYRELDDFITTDTTKEPGVDRPWHELLPMGAAVKYAIIRNMDSTRNLKQTFEEKLMMLREYYSRRQDDKSPVLLPQARISDYS